MTKACIIDKNHLPYELTSDQVIVKAITALDRMLDEEERLINESRMQFLKGRRKQNCRSRRKRARKCGKVIPLKIRYAKA